MSETRTTLVFLDENTRTTRSMEVSGALATAVARAELVNEGKDAFAVSFSSLFIGLLATPDPTGNWLRMQFDRSKADLDGLLRRRGLKRDELDMLMKTGPASPKTERPLTRTASARHALEDAEQRATRAGRVTDTAHVLESLISLRGFHDSDFQELGIRTDAWRAAFDESPMAAAQPGARAANESSAAALPQPGTEASDFDASAAGVESHVGAVLKNAGALAGSSTIGPSHVINAIWMYSAERQPASEAFARFLQLVPRPEKLEMPPQGAVRDAIGFDADLRGQLARAQRPKPGTTEPSPVWGRDLVTAVLLCPDEQLQRDVASAGQFVETVRDRWYGFVTSNPGHRPVAEWAAWWREANVPLPGPRRAGYSLETDIGDDKLGVDREARAFARLILDKDVHPPLSIGLLGDWGSGKSFFIEQIKKGIGDLKAEGRPELHDRVVEIEFNAWHASDSNLWASLVTKIFDEIWENVAPSDARRDPQEARKRLQKQIEQARGAVHEAEAQVQLGQQALELAERDLKQKREILAWNSYVRSITSEKLASLAQNAGWHHAIETINDVEKAVRTLAVSGNRFRTVLSVLLEKPLLHIALPTALLMALTGAIWLLVDASTLDAWQARLSKVLATVAGAIATLVAPLRIARQRIDSLTSGLESIQKEYQEKLDQAKTNDAGRAQAEEVERARRELESAQASVNTARTRLAELLNQQATLDPQRRLGTFLQERVQSTQYRSQQGIISLVHKDFSELSKYMKDLREAAGSDPHSTAQQRVTAPDADAIRPFDRIVLYVDDLDRCRPAHVVNMLEAVHLLLALDLFVVVVAVDSRWLTRALEVYYHDLLADEDGKQGSGLRTSTPQNYLEKIFQITYALAPMDPNRFGDYVRFLAGTGGDGKAPAGPKTEPPQVPAADTARAAQAPAATAGPMTGNVARGPGEKADTAGQQSETKTPPSPPRPSPPVRISQEECKFITRLVPLLPTPRIAKRLVNVYRVIKAGKSAQELEAFERAGRNTTCLLVLAILFGRPVVAGGLLRMLHERKLPFDNPNALFTEAVAGHKPAGEPQEITDAWTELGATLKTMGIVETVGACAREPYEVARYSLLSGHDWHTWSNRPAGE